MKRDPEIQQMHKKIIILDIIVGLALAIGAYFIKPDYALISLLGFLIAIFCFYFNSYTAQYAIATNRSNVLLWIALGKFLRILIVCVLGVVLYLYNNLNIIAYIIGYTWHLLSLMIYALLLKK